MGSRPKKATGRESPSRCYEEQDVVYVALDESDGQLDDVDRILNPPYEVALYRFQVDDVDRDPDPTYQVEGYWFQADDVDRDSNPSDDVDVDWDLDER